MASICLGLNVLTKEAPDRVDVSEQWWMDEHTRNPIKLTWLALSHADSRADISGGVFTHQPHRLPVDMYMCDENQTKRLIH